MRKNNMKQKRVKPTKITVCGGGIEIDIPRTKRFFKRQAKLIAYMLTVLLQGFSFIIAGFASVIMVAAGGDGKVTDGDPKTAMTCLAIALGAMLLHTIAERSRKFMEVRARENKKANRAYCETQNVPQV